MASGCEFDERAIGAGQPTPVVHAVLNPGSVSDEYVVLLERTLTGRVDARSEVRDPADPVKSGGGDPISGARVEIMRLDSATSPAVGVEDAAWRDDRKGAGVYRFYDVDCVPSSCLSNSLRIVAGARYRLRIVLPEGGTIEGETDIPLPQGPPDIVAPVGFDRERDTLWLTWPAAARTQRYVVAVQTPYGPLHLFTDTNAVRLTGGLRNIVADRLPLVFTPGFRQSVQVAAVDMNYYDWMRTRNDPFTGAGLVSRLRGGTGVFGSYVPIRTGVLDVRAPQDEPIEGTWTGNGIRLELYATGTNLVSGRSLEIGGRSRGVLGTRDGNQLRFVVLRGQQINDTLSVHSAELLGDELEVRGQLGSVRLRREP